MAATHYVGQFQVLQEVGRQLHHLMLVGGAEVHVVVEYGTMLVGMLQESQHLWTNDRIQRIVAAEYHDVVLVHGWVVEVQPVLRMVFVEHVFRIVLFVEECQGKW